LFDKLLDAYSKSLDVKVKCILLSTICHVLFSQASYAEDIYPNPDWKRKSHAEVFNESAFSDVLRYIEKGQKENDANDYSTDGFLIIKDNHLVFEKYYHGFNKDKPHILWSATKSFVNTLYGISEYHGILSREDFAYKYFSILNFKEKRKITISHLLRMSAGLDWMEGYGINFFNLYKGKLLDSNVVEMLYMETDMGAYSAEQKLAHKPNKQFYYSSGTSNILMSMLKTKFSKDDYDAMPWKYLFEPLGMSNVTWEQDQAGTFIGSSYLYMTLRELAKLGLLYLKNGIWNGKRLLPKDWVQYSTSVAPAFAETNLEGFANRENYGAHWWLNKSNKEKGLKRPYPDAPESLYMALGHYGQSLAIFPEQNMLVVRTAYDKDGEINRNTLYKLILGALK